jgi:hypothetical protein
VHRTRDWWADQRARRETGHGQIPGEVVDITEPQPSRDDDGDLYFGDDPTDPNGTRLCPTCRGKFFVDGGLCPDCGQRDDARREDFRIRYPDHWINQMVNPTKRGTDMTEVAETNFETTLAQLDLLEQKLSQVDAATETLEQLRTEIRDEVSILVDMLTAVNIDGATAAGLDQVVDALSPQHIDPLVQAHEVGSAALAATRENVIATYSDAADVVASTGVDAPFLQPA